MVLEARSLKSRYHRALLPLKFPGGRPSLTLPATGGCRCSLAHGCILLASASDFTWPFPFLSVSLLKGYLSLDLGSPWVIQDDLISRCVIILTKIFFFFQLSSLSQVPGVTKSHLSWLPDVLCPGPPCAAHPWQVFISGAPWSVLCLLGPSPLPSHGPCDCTVSSLSRRHSRPVAGLQPPQRGSDWKGTCCLR